MNINPEQILREVYRNKLYTNIFSNLDELYFSLDFNIKVDEYLSNTSAVDLIHQYISYYELSNIFLFLYSNSDMTSNLFPDDWGINERNRRIILLLIYKEINFFMLKLETFSGIDLDLSLEVLNTNNIKEYDYIYGIDIDKENIEKLNSKGLIYYLSKNKVISYLDFIQNLNFKISA